MGTKRAVIDRVEGALAVLLVGEDEREMTLPLRSLPPGSVPGVWLRVAMEGDRVTFAEIDTETTRQRRAKMQEKLDRLLKRKPPQP